MESDKVSREGAGAEMGMLCAWLGELRVNLYYVRHNCGLDVCFWRTRCCVRREDVDEGTV